MDATKLLIAIMQDDLIVNINSFHVAVHPNFGLGSLTVEVYSSHTVRYTPCRTPLNV